MAPVTSGRAEPAGDDRLAGDRPGVLDDAAAAAALSAVLAGIGLVVLDVRVERLDLLAAATTSSLDDERPPRREPRRTGEPPVEREDPDAS